MLLCKMWGVCIENNDLKNLHIRQKASADGVISQLKKKKKKLQLQLKNHNKQCSQIVTPLSGSSSVI
jgi:hypothetical protein